MNITSAFGRFLDPIADKLLIAMICVYLIIAAILAKRNPFQFLKDIRTAQIVAFSTSSSAATMPVSLSVAEERLKTHKDVHGFVVPLGATINMDGTALYQACAAIFLCQVFGIDLSMGETILLLLTTIGASIGTPAMPGVGLIVLATILSSIGVPAEGIGIILGVDRLLDMLRTSVNVTGDLTATIVMDQWMHGKT
jgi:Na+/H+-dicarboxylate symporter